MKKIMEEDMLEAAKNRFLRTMLIVIMANIGSSIGTMIAGIDIVKNLL